MVPSKPVTLRPMLAASQWPDNCLSSERELYTPRGPLAKRQTRSDNDRINDQLLGRLP